MTHRNPQKLIKHLACSIRNAYQVLVKIRKKNNPLVITIGRSSGLGLETALTLAENGFITYATMRNLNNASNILEPAQRKNLPIKVLQLYVTDDI